MIIYSYRLRIKLSIFCLSVKSPSCSRSLVIHKIRSALDNNVLRSENSFWLSGCIYLLTDETEKIEAPYLASLPFLMQNWVDHVPQHFHHLISWNVHTVCHAKLIPYISKTMDRLLFFQSSPTNRDLILRLQFY